MNVPKFAYVHLLSTGLRPDKDQIYAISIWVPEASPAPLAFESYVRLPAALLRKGMQVVYPSHIQVEQTLPYFYEIAKSIIEATDQCILVSFEIRKVYAFLKAAFKDFGYNYQRKTLSLHRLLQTVDAAQVDENWTTICSRFGIQLPVSMHDVLSTSKAYHALYLKLQDQVVQTKQANWLSLLPTQLTDNQWSRIPSGVTGVYFLKDRLGKILYIGKANDVRKRLQQHFALTQTGNRRALQFKDQIAEIEIHNMGHPLLALLAESQAIKQHLPPFNFAQKKTKVQPLYGLFIEHDADGYACLQIDRKIQNRKPFLYFDTKEEAKNSLRYLSTVYQLCLSKTSLNTGPGACFHYHIQKCKGACIGLENSLDYNQRVHAFASASNISTVDEIWKMKGRYAYEFGFIWLENGVLKGMGFASKSEQNINLETFEKHLEPLHFNRDIHRILLQFKWDPTIEKIEIRKHTSKDPNEKKKEL